MRIHANPCDAIRHAMQCMPVDTAQSTNPDVGYVAWRFRENRRRSIALFVRDHVPNLYLIAK